jgi:hypothetical protein
MASRKKPTKGKAKPSKGSRKSDKAKRNPRTPKGGKLKKAKLKKGSIFTNLTGKKQELRYRDIKGHFIKPEKINGKRLVKWEIWRYSEHTRKWKKLDFGNKWESKYRKLKKAKSLLQAERIIRLRYQRHHIKVRMIKGEVYAYTASP